MTLISALFLNEFTTQDTKHPFRLVASWTSSYCFGFAEKAKSGTEGERCTQE